MEQKTKVSALLDITYIHTHIMCFVSYEICTMERNEWGDIVITNKDKQGRASLRRCYLSKNGKDTEYLRKECSKQREEPVQSPQS